MQGLATLTLGTLFSVAASAAALAEKQPPLAPVAVCPARGGAQLLVIGSEGRCAQLLDRATLRRLLTVALPAPASGAAVAGNTAYVTTDEPAGRLLTVDLDTGAIRRELRVGHTPVSPLLSADGRTLYAACRFDDAVAFVDLKSGSVPKVPALRQPVALALSPDGRRLFVANHLPVVEPALDDENPDIAAEISVLDARTAAPLASVRLPNGSQGLRGIAVSPDGRWAVATHILSHYTVPPLRVDEGAMNMNALSLVDAQTLEWVETVMLDDPTLGAANPWAVAFAQDGRRLVVTHAGTHELSVIDFPKLVARVAARPSGSTGLYSAADLHTLAGLRQRVPLGVNGPRALAVVGDTAYVPGYFSDTLAAVDLRSGTGILPVIHGQDTHASHGSASASFRLGAASPPTATVVPLGDGPAARSAAWRGEAAFNDATGCRQRWQSCATCHPDGRDDALYWDLLNDGDSNTKNTKSLLMATLTPPAMWRGIRADAMTAIQAGFHHIEFTEPRAGEAADVATYLQEMRTVPSPFLNAFALEPPRTNSASCAKCHRPGVPRGTLTEAARRGKALFEGRAGCAACHPHPTFTTGKQVDPGLGAGVPYDIPSLVEVWRTAPYMHGGDAVTLPDAVINHNFLQKRGRTKDLSDQEIEDLLAYVRSL